MARGNIKFKFRLSCSGTSMRSCNITCKMSFQPLKSVPALPRTTTSVLYPRFEEIWRWINKRRFQYLLQCNTTRFYCILRMAGLLASIWGMVLEVVLFWQRVCSLRKTSIRLWTADITQALCGLVEAKEACRDLVWCPQKRADIRRVGRGSIPTWRITG